MVKDVYILYYDPQWQSSDLVYALILDVQRALPDKPVLALPRDTCLKDLSRDELKKIYNQIGEFLKVDSDDTSDDTADTKNSTLTKWSIWSGWRNTRDKRIQNATCIVCGYVHPTVFKSPQNLPTKCPRCSRMVAGLQEF